MAGTALTPAQRDALDHPPLPTKPFSNGVVDPDAPFTENEARQFVQSLLNRPATAAEIAQLTSVPRSQAGGLIKSALTPAEQKFGTDADKPPPEPTATTPTPAAPSSPSPSPSDGFFGGPGATDLTAPFTDQFVAPTPQAIAPAPTFTAPVYKAPPAFAFGDFQAPGPFVAPSVDAMLADPGYQARKDQAAQAFMANRAASQTAHTGGTIKEFLDYSQNQASQEYGNVWQRDYSAYNSNFTNALNTYGTNRANAVGTYNTNYQTQYQDPWNIENTRAQEAFAPQLLDWQTGAANTQHANDLANSNALNKWYQDYNIFRNQQTDTFDKRFKVATA